MQKYDIYLNLDRVGTAEIIQEGLYYRIVCTCNFNNPAVHRIILNTGVEKINLGICIPQNQECVLIKKIPVKRIKADELFFFAQDAQVKADVEQFVLSAEKLEVPIAQIRNMRYKICNDKSIVYVD